MFPRRGWGEKGKGGKAQEVLTCVGGHLKINDQT